MAPKNWIEKPATQKDALNIHTVDSLKEIARAIPGAKNIPNKKSEIIDYLITQSSQDCFLKQFNDLQIKLLAETIYNYDGNADMVKFEAKYGASPYTMKSPSDIWSYQQASLLDIFIVDGVMPDDIREKLKLKIDPPPQTTIFTKSSLPESVIQYEESYFGKKEIEVCIQERQTEQAALKNLFTLLRLVESGKVKVSSASKQPSGATISLVSEYLCDGDWYPSPCYGGIQGFALTLLLQVSGLATATTTTLGLTTRGKNVLAGKISVHDAVKNIWSSWISKALIDEFSRIDVIKGQKSKGRVLSAASSRRATVQNALTNCPKGKWITIADFGRFMRAEGMYFEVALDVWKLYISDSHYGALGYQGSHSWEMLQERYIKVLLMEYAATLGIIDIGYAPPESVARDFNSAWGTDDLEYLSRYDGLLFLRVNALGEYVLGNSHEYSPAPEEIPQLFDVLPNFDIIVTDVKKLSSADRIYLGKFAAPVTEYQWKISPQTIRSALEMGDDVAMIRGFLAKRSKNALPQTVEVLLSDAESYVANFIIEGKAYLLRCADLKVLAIIQHDLKLKALSFVNHPQLVTILPGKEKLFFKRLNDLGYAVPMASQIV